MTDVAPDEPYDALQPEGDPSSGIAAAIAQQSTAITACCPPGHSIRGCAWGPCFRKSTAEYYKRRSAQGKDAERSGARDQYLLFTNVSTTAQEAPAIQACPSDRSRADRCVGFDLSREAGRLQSVTGAIENLDLWHGYWVMQSMQHRQATSS